MIREMKKLKKFEDWNIAAGGLIAILFFLLGYFIGVTYKGNEVKNDFITCGIGATCPSTHFSEYIGWQCIECTYKEGEKDFNYNFSTICQEYQQSIKERFENLKDTAVSIAEAQGENCSNISWQECLYNKGEGISIKPTELYCYRVPSPSKCEYIELKNGTLIPKGLCYTTYNYLVRCINKSEVSGVVTK